ncbi:hypothetical protein PV328_000832 [Microctonus aethiopoides]|uniref:HTH psq-type domain-containing protein n=1 Tax=Microctonus aethiopoides TaxID=144406 RepID=A0AA39FW72_9HYME|nr:hypothetical protein PV328_000832 [Microctonus aethiopoides]
MESGSNLPTPGNYPSGDRQQVHGLSSQGHDNNQSESPTSINSSSVPTTPTTPVKQTSSTATLTETPGMVKMEPDEQFFQQQDKPNSISMVPTSNCNTTTSSPFPATEGYQRRRRRPESELILASEMVARGETFQAAAEKYNIPISTIHFYMVRKGYLQYRKRERVWTDIFTSNIRVFRFVIYCVMLIIMLFLIMKITSRITDTLY